MRTWPRALTRLVNELSRLPGIGEKTATRMAMVILDRDRDYAASLGQALFELHDNVQRCQVCNALSEEDVCAICADDERDPSLLCVVQSYGDLVAIERTGTFGGRYHVLRGLIRPLDGVGPEAIGIDQLEERVKREGCEEVIIATSASVEGESTALYIRDRLAPAGVRLSRIARGLPLGGEVEYADRATLGRALASRQKMDEDPS